MKSELESDIILDSTRIFNSALRAVKKSFIYLKFGSSISPSAWQDYPKKYKFFGLFITTSDRQVVIRRKTFDILELFQKFGGLKGALMMMITPLVAGLAK